MHKKPNTLCMHGERGWDDMLDDRHVQTRHAPADEGSADSVFNGRSSRHGVCKGENARRGQREHTSDAVL